MVMFNPKNYSAMIQGGIAISKLLRLRRQYSEIPFIRPRFSEEVGFFYTAYIEPREKQIDIVLYKHGFSDGRGRGVFAAAIKRAFVPIFMAWHARDEVKRLVCNLSDGDRPSKPAAAFSSFSDEDYLVPDPYFFNNNGFFDNKKAYAEAGLPWSKRSDELVWRGGPNNNGVWSRHLAVARHPSAAQRLAIAYAAHEAGIDFKFVLNSGLRPHIELEDLLIHEKFIGDKVPAESWLGRRFALDVDGFTNTWDNLFLRMAMGCCVLKVDSHFGYRQWYYDRLVPYEHFVPVKADGSDLAEKYDWVRSESKKAQEIAKNGQNLVREMTFETEMKLADQAVRKNWKNYV